jgi:predicted CopG family antitoxin
LKTVRVSDETHKKLTRLLGELMAKTGKAQTFNDVINDLIERSQENAAR